jgi:hypothetical protein
LEEKRNEEAQACSVKLDNFNNLEVIMLEVTSSAVENLKTYLADNNIESAIRISLMQGG